MEKKPRQATTTERRTACDLEPQNDPAENQRRYAESVIAPEVATYRVIQAVEPKGLTDQIEPTMLMRLLSEQIAAVKSGDMGSAEAALVAQANALQTLFVRLTERAMSQDYLPNLEAMLKLALRAQAQGRATLETLAAMKNPPFIYAKQANLANGPQQVNNGVDSASRPRKTRKAPNELLEHDHGERLDTRATSEASGPDPELASVGCIDRADKR